jgi:hypothetical protein
VRGRWIGQGYLGEVTARIEGPASPAVGMGSRQLEHAGLDRGQMDRNAGIGGRHEPPVVLHVEELALVALRVRGAGGLHRADAFDVLPHAGDRLAEHEPMPFGVPLRGRGAHAQHKSLPLTSANDGALSSVCVGDLANCAMPVPSRTRYVTRAIAVSGTKAPRQTSTVHMLSAPASSAICA